MSIVTQNPLSGQTKSKGDLLYEEVIYKNFQVISELMEKLTSIYTKQEEIEANVAATLKKCSKIESEVEVIHNEHRRQNLCVYSKMHSLRGQVDGLDNHIRIMYEQLKDKGIAYYPASSITHPNNQNIANVQSKGINEIQESESQSSQTDSLQESMVDIQGVKEIDEQGQIRQSNVRVTRKILNFEKQDVKKQQTNCKIHFQDEISQQMSHKPNKMRVSIEQQNGTKQTNQKSRIGKVHKILKNPSKSKIYPVSFKQNITNKFRTKQSYKTIVQKKQKTYSKSQAYLKIKQPNLETITNYNDPPKQENVSTSFRYIVSQKTMGSKKQKNKKGNNQIFIESINLIQNDFNRFLNDFSEFKKQVRDEVNKINKKMEEFATKQELREEVRGLLIKNSQLRDDCRATFANKAETRKAVLFLGKNIQSKSQQNTIDQLNWQDQDDEQNQKKSTCLVSKCLLCDRVVQRKKIDNKKWVIPIKTINKQNKAKSHASFLKQKKSINEKLAKLKD